MLSQKNQDDPHPASAQKIRREIGRAFARQAEDDARRVYVTVDGSTVFLKGSVRSFVEHQDALEAAHHARGIVDVHDEIRVVP
ncbi:MAG TPA: BON domain-containing protein [Chloroflexota bacterium]|nr:BON domain-containing protein [Chloroflexota bacterium]